jgi:histidinol-phosphate/aromatic aminotransferase/cobyric acid decarboxylase-like protein
MPLIEQHALHHVKPYIRDAWPYIGGSARDRNRKNLVKLSSNENALGPSPKAMAAIRENLETLQEYRFESDVILPGSGICGRDAASGRNG